MNYVLKSCKEQSVATVARVCLTEDTLSHDSRSQTCAFPIHFASLLNHHNVNMSDPVDLWFCNNPQAEPIVEGIGHQSYIW